MRATRADWRLRGAGDWVGAPSCSRRSALGAWWTQRTAGTNGCSGPGRVYCTPVGVSVWCVDLSSLLLHLQFFARRLRDPAGSSSSRRKSTDADGRKSRARLTHEVCSPRAGSSTPVWQTPAARADVVAPIGSPRCERAPNARRRRNAVVDVVLSHHWLLASARRRAARRQLLLRAERKLSSASPPRSRSSARFVEPSLSGRPSTPRVGSMSFSSR